MPKLPRSRNLPVALVVLGALSAHHDANAINGALPGGNGIQNASMGGASIALPLDAAAAANNVAGLAFVPNSTVFDVQVFHGHSTADYVLPGNRLDNKQTIPAPEGGFAWQLSPSLTAGFSIAGAGAGSDYGQQALPVEGAATAKTTLRLAEVIPTIAWKPRPDLALGLGLALTHEQFEASGVVVPAPVPGGLLPLPSHGRQSANGVGWRAGVLWKPDEQWAIGASLKPRTHMSRLDGYRDDLLAYSDGRLDVPAQYGIGVAWQPTPRVTLAMDWLRIEWSGMKAMQDPNGFHWRDQPVLRFGASWALDDRWTVRAGVSGNRRQIESEDAAQNLLVPSIHSRAYTAGLGWRLDARSQVNLGYELDPHTTLTGTGPSTGTTLSSRVQMFMFGYQYTF